MPKNFKNPGKKKHCDDCKRETFLSFPFTYEGKDDKRVCTSCHKVFYTDCTIRIAPMSPNPDKPMEPNNPDKHMGPNNTDKYGGKSKKKSEKARKSGNTKKKSLKKSKKKSLKK